MRITRVQLIRSREHADQVRVRVSDDMDQHSEHAFADHMMVRDVLNIAVRDHCSEVSKEFPRPGVTTPSHAGS